MSFDDRLRDELRKATEAHPLDAEDALRGVRATEPTASAADTDGPIAIPLEPVEVPRRSRVRARRIVGVAAAIALIAGAIAIPFALRDQPHDTARRVAPHRTSNKNLLANRVALQAVASAVDATTNAGSFHVDYAIKENPSSTPTTTTCHSLSYYAGPAIPPATNNRTSVTQLLCGANVANNVTTSGSATVNVSPFAMKADSNVSNFGAVTVRVDDTDYWESTGTDTATPTAAGQPISSFAGLVESTLGPREGAGAMMGLASPSGYLSITRAAITGAKELGTGSIDGTPVTNYRVTVDPALLAQVPELSAEQRKTIVAAIAVLQREGFTGNTTDVSVDAQGFIVHTTSTNNFADGGSVVSDDTFSLFGCAGAVDIPGRPVSPPSCVDPNAAPTTVPAGSTAPTTTLLPGTAASGGVATPITGLEATTTTGPPMTVTTIPAGATPTITTGTHP